VYPLVLVFLLDYRLDVAYVEALLVAESLADSYFLLVAAYLVDWLAVESLVGLYSSLVAVFLALSIPLALAS